MIKSIYQRFNFLKQTQLLSSNSYVLFDKKIELQTTKSSSIEVNGILKIGGSYLDCIELPSYDKTKIILEENSKLIVEGDLSIGSGTFIHVKKNATLKFGGKNFIGHNNFIRCSEYVLIGKNTSTSWNVTLIDNDGHELFFEDGRKLKRKKTPLIIEKNVGLQMNVTIPRGVTIYENCLIGANTVVREDIPKNTFAYHKNELRRKNGISAGLQFFN